MVRGRLRRCALLTGALLAVGGAAPSAQGAEDLASFDTCSEVVDYAGGGAGLDSWPAWSTSEDASLGLRGPYPEPDADDEGGVYDHAYDDADNVVSDAVEDSEAAPASGGAADDVSGTNTQEVGIDEPDLFKTDGRLLFVIAGSELRVMTGRTEVPRAIARLPLEIAGGELLISGDKLLVLGYVPGRPQQTGAESAPARYPKYPRSTRLIEVDISDRTAPRVLRTLDAPGVTAAARQIGSTVRVVVNTVVDEGWEYDEEEDDYDDVDLDLNDVLPTTRLKSAVTGDRYQRRMAPCDQVDRPAGFSGNDLVSIFTFDLERGLIGIRREALMANAQVVYASSTSLYIASGRYVNWDFAKGAPDDTYTDVHAFDLTEPGRTTYTGTGRVLGIPLNKYSFSEWEGELRVATTTEPGWVKDAVEQAVLDACEASGAYDDDAEEGEANDACYEADGYREAEVPVDNRVTVLRPQGTGFVQAGLAEGIGRGGYINAVRFDGPRGYVVTTTETAPIATLDLSDPEAPKVVGQLTIPGTSAYLHPLGDGLLLGVGQDKDDAKNRIGGVVSLFDVSDPAGPRRISKRNLGRGYSGAEYDPHAFLWWPRRKLILLPFTRYEDVPDYYDDWGYWEGIGELVGLTASRKSEPNLKEIGRITHGPPWDHPDVVRGVVFGDRLLSISELGVGTSRVDDLTPIGYLPFLPYVQDLTPERKPCTTVPGTTPTTPPTTPTTPGTTPTTPTTRATPGTTPAAAAARRSQAAPTTPPASTTPGTTPRTTPETTPATTPAATTPIPAGCAAPRTPSVAATTPPTTPGTTPTTTTPGTTPIATPKP